jgi:hypothetical protein
VEGRIYAGSLHIRHSLPRKAFGTWRIGSKFFCVGLSDVPMLRPPVDDWIEWTLGEEAAD